MCDPLAPDKYAASPPGIIPPASPGRGANALPGLRVHRSLRSRSPGKAFTPRPGKNRQKKYLNRTRAP
ncbi:hypothetical protein F3K27_10865 [Klebsiella grimontii]|nr:hypothetical protein [Klebsiella grimontii]